MRTQRYALFTFSRREITVALSVAVACLWLTIGWYVVTTQPLLGGDFIAFYTLGAAARAGQWAMQYDWPRLWTLQISLVPASDAYMYPPTYPPLFAALYAPLTGLRFEAAYAVYASATAATYAALIAVASRGCVAIARPHAVLGCALLPSFVMHIVMGQTTIWPLMGFVGGWWALQRGQPFVAGIIFSLVSIKPHFGMAMAVVLPLTRSWWVVGGVASGATVHALLTLAICGPATIAAYVHTTVVVLRDPSLIEPAQSHLSHAWRPLVDTLAPEPYGTAIWLAGAFAICWLVVRVWHCTGIWTLRMAALLFGTFLVTPHAIGYDGVLLAPAMLWVLDWSLSTRDRILLLGLTVMAGALAVQSPLLGGFPLTASATICVLARLNHQLRLRQRVPSA
jgi:hypothetical protein